MALPTPADAKSYLRIETTAEDTLIGDLVAQATGAVQSYVSVPLVARLETFTVEGRGIRHALVLDAESIDASAGVTVVDGNGTTVDASTYRVDARTGILYALPGYCFVCFPYTVTVTWGLSTRLDYAVEVEPVLRAAILDVVADRYQRRNPAASSESSGGGVATAYDPKGMPQRVCDALDPYARVPR